MHLGLGEGAYLTLAPPVASVTETDELLDLVEREAEVLVSFDEAVDGDRLLRIVSVPRWTSLRLGEQAPPFVVTQGVDVDACSCGNLADLHVRSVSWVRKGRVWTMVQSQDYFPCMLSRHPDMRLDSVVAVQRRVGYG